MSEAPEVDELEVAKSVVTQACGRKRFADAVSWLAEDRPLPESTDWSQLLRALVMVAAGDVGNRAVRRVVREAVKSEVDTARVLFDPESIHRPEDYGAALHALATSSPDGTLSGLTPSALLKAQRVNTMSVETLCLVAGVPYGDACEWFHKTSGPWAQQEVAALLEFLDELVTGRATSPIPNSIPARAIELVSGLNGWESLDTLRRDGVPYEVLLAQRSAGGAWLAHKNRTSSLLNISTADMVCTLLERRGIKFLRATTVGGPSRQADLQALTGIMDKRVSVVVLSRRRPAFVVAFSSAKDGGTARANSDGLLQIPESPLPCAIVLTGLGWSKRPETDRLARRFKGLVFTERNVTSLVNLIQESL